MERKSTLKTVEYRLHDYIKQESKNGKWLHQTDLQNYLCSIGYNVSLRDVRRYIYNIRNSDEFQTIILTNYKLGYRMLSSVEEKAYLIKKVNHYRKHLAQAYNDIKKFNRDGQMRITFTDYEKNIYESILNTEQEEI